MMKSEERIMKNDEETRANASTSSLLNVIKAT
jgi:hypothetical protein